MDREPSASQPASPAALAPHEALIARALETAIANKTISVHFQPIIRLSDGSIDGFEALARWRHSEQGDIPPDIFVPIAEATGQIVALGLLVLEQALKEARGWPRDVSLSVNVSPRQIAEPHHATEMLALILKSGIAPHRLHLEATEGLLLEPDQATLHFLSRMRREGVSFALDDFGTGYSSLAYLDQFPFARIKLDKAFAQRSANAGRSAAIRKAVSDLAAALDMDVIAEGLETASQVADAVAAGCAFGQGYFFSRPVPAAMVRDLLVHQFGKDALPPIEAE